MSLLRTQRRNALKTILFWACLMIPASAFLYSTNTHVRSIENELEATQQQVAQEKEALRVLHAEWAYLNSPQRLAAETKRHFGEVRAAQATQVLPMQSLPTGIAMNDSADKMNIAAGHASTPVLAKPIAYDGSLLASLHHDDKATLPAAASWSQKVVSAFGFASNLLSRSTP